MSFVNLAHQEKYYNNPSASKTLQIFNCFSLAKNKSEASLYLKYTRFFGSGTTIFIMMLAIIFYDNDKIKRFFKIY